MEIIVKETKRDTYRCLITGRNINMTVVYVEFPEHDVFMGLSRRDNEPEGQWLADSRFDSGRPVFCHGEGDRTCDKQIAGPELVAAIEAAL